MSVARQRLWALMVGSWAIGFAVTSSACAQPKPLVSCKPASERTGTEGCWIVADHSIGGLQNPTYWILDVLPNKAAAQNVTGYGTTVIEALGKVWLMTLSSERNPKPNPEATRVAVIGPLWVTPEKVLTKNVTGPMSEGPGRQYTAQYMEAILEPGAVSRTHTHSGPEAFYTETGESCLETPASRQIGRKGVGIVVPEGVPMELVATGTETRRSIVLVLHDSSKPPTTVVEWTSKGLCKAEAK